MNQAITRGGPPFRRYYGETAIAGLIAGVCRSRAVVQGTPAVASPAGPGVGKTAYARRELPREGTMKVVRVLGMLATVLAGSLVVAGPAQATVGCGPSTANGWQEMFAALPTYGDGNISTTLDSGRCVVLTGDAIPRAGGPWAHDTITVVSGGTAHVVQPAYPNTQSPYQAVPDRGDGTVDWLGPAFFANGTLYSFAPNIRPLASGWDNIGVNVAVFDVPAGGDPRFSGFLPTPTDIANPVYWGAGVYYDRVSGYVYVFGASAIATDGWTGHDVYVARVRLGDLAKQRSWTYFASGSWKSAQADATPILRSSVNGGAETVFAVWNDSRGWKITSKRGGQWGPGEIVRWSTPDLGGEWTETVLATIPGDNYIHYEHWALPVTGSRQHLFTYNTAGHDATWTAVPRP